MPRFITGRTGLEPAEPYPGISSLVRAVEDFAAHLQFHFRGQRWRSQRAEHLALFHTEIEIEAQVMGAEVQGDVLVGAEGNQCRVRRHPGAESCQDGFHLPDHVRRGCNNRRRRDSSGGLGLFRLRRLGVALQVGDGGAAYEVEIKLDDGTVTEVELDSDFTVIGDATDDDGDDSQEGDDSDD